MKQEWWRAVWRWPSPGLSKQPAGWVTCLLVSAHWAPGMCQAFSRILKLSEKGAGQTCPFPHAGNISVMEARQPASVVQPFVYFGKVSWECSRSTKKGHHCVRVRESLLRQVCCGTENEFTEFQVLCTQQQGESFRELLTCKNILLKTR